MFTPALVVLALCAADALAFQSVLAHPTQETLTVPRKTRGKYYDIQGHRGGRGNTVESTLPSFAWGLIHGATTLELDNGITKDGAVIVWHDESIVGAKCQDTEPAFDGDPDYPYVGKFVANLTLAQIKTLDCGSKRQHDFPMQLTYPGTRISTLQEVFDFVLCVDTSRQIQWNIESKIDARYPNRTRSVDDFVRRQHQAFANSGYKDSITFQSFDWRSLVAMKTLDPYMTTSALIDDETAITDDESASPWLAGLRLDDFEGPTLGEKVAQAASFISADILSPSADSFVNPSPSPKMDGYMAFTTQEMVDEAHRLGMEVKPWTVNNLDVVDLIASYGVDGIITDYPDVVRRWAQQEGLPVAPKFAKRQVLACLNEHLRRQHGDKREEDS